MIRLAATVMLVRPSGARGFEVLMVRRSAASHFVPDAYVFPGGTVDPQDYAEGTLARIYGVDETLLRGNFRSQSAPHFPAPLQAVNAREASALIAAGLRELYEEAGVLLACDAHGRPCGSQSADAARVAYPDALEALNAFGDARALALFSQWITPPAYPKRYNAHFFLALAPQGQAARADAVETHDGVWIAPARALEQSRLGRFSLVYPTIKHLERLAAFDDACALLQFTRNKPIYAIMPETQSDAPFSIPHDLEMAW
ncbi:MAG: hypothetical protein ABR508_00875 [Candidatus Baltobacteraceae bacterium]